MTDGDRRFVELYEGYYRKVYGYCRRRTTAERVDDAVAETFLTAWRKIADVPDGDDALPWLYSVAYRVLGHQWRTSSRQSRLKTRLAAVGVDQVEMPEEFVVMDQESRQVLDALQRLKHSDQELLRLTVWEELSHRDIARVLGVSTDAVKKRSSRARQALAREFEQAEKKYRTSPAAQEGGTW